MIRAVLVSSQDADRWRAALPTNAHVMGSLEYTRICERQAGLAARLFLVEWADGRIAYPLLLRPIEALPFGAAIGRGFWDTITPEYTGPLRLGKPPAEADAAQLRDLFASQCRENRIVAEFAHLNPWYAAAELLEPDCVETDREIVYLDLTLGEEAIWTKSFTTDARRQTKQAEKAGVRCRRATSPEDVLAFHKLYELTMERRSALERYHFPPEYFLAFHHTLPENSLFVLAEYQGRAVAGGLYLYDATDVYWHLSAADMEFSRVRPVNAYHWDAIRWAVRAGKRRMLCGGGYEHGDGVFRFKANFSPLRAQFKTYKRIHDRDRYTLLMEAWSAHHGAQAQDTGFFPAYRASPPETTLTPQPALAAAGDAAAP